MQQAYRVLRVVSEAQTIRMVLSSQPDELMLSELVTACALYAAEPETGKAGNDGVKAIVLDFASSPAANFREAPTATTPSAVQVERARKAVQALASPVLAIVRTTLSPEASALASAADLLLAAHDALLTITDPQCQHDRLTGEQAARLGYVTWSAPANSLKDEMERILDMLRDKSAIALRYAKVAVRLGIEAGGGQKATCEEDDQLVAPPEKGASAGTRPSTANAEQRLAALKKVNAFYLDSTMQTEDAREGLHSFLEKRKALWKNH
jgi:hypothetical protein